MKRLDQSVLHPLIKQPEAEMSPVIPGRLFADGVHIQPGNATREGGVSLHAVFLHNILLPAIKGTVSTDGFV
jgi:hypothetical protein